MAGDDFSDQRHRTGDRGVGEEATSQVAHVQLMFLASAEPRYNPRKCSSYIDGLMKIKEIAR